MTKYTIKQLMTKHPEVISQDSSLKDAAEAMEKADCGVMPVGTPDKLVGMITDRDIVIRAIARGKDPAKTRVRDVMTNKVFSVADDASLDEAAEIISREKVNRLVVKDSKGKLAGIFSLSGLCKESADQQAIAEFARSLAARPHRKAA